MEAVLAPAKGEGEEVCSQEAHRVHQILLFIFYCGRHPPPQIVIVTLLTRSYNLTCSYSFTFISPEAIGRIIGGVRPITCILDPCPFWLIKEARSGLWPGGTDGLDKGEQVEILP